MRFLPLLIIGLFSWLNAQSPHGMGFKLECADCHTTASWKIVKSEMTFNHTSTGFQLIGQHNSVDCRGCHQSLIFADAKSECAACHNDVHKATLSSDCSKCHSPKSWLVSDIYFMHQQSRFPLAGVHRTADCSQCHSRSSELIFESPGIDCYDCHNKDYSATTTPAHLANNFSKACETCHDYSSKGWKFAATAHSFFPLTGGHARNNCYDCHQATTFSGLNRECASCHITDFNNTLNPNHTANNFSTNCSTCHNIESWKPAYFDHKTTNFPLTGKHFGVDCGSCHSNGYNNTSTLCQSCHINQYNNTNNPNHRNAGFPVTCVDCHTSNGWTPAQFDHDGRFFPIYSGKHRNKWSLCSDCHRTSGNYSSFSCIDCHEHNRTDMDNEHRGVNGYIYQSSACFNCHPKGDENGAFNHNNTGFQLIGAHLNVECSRCHTAGISGPIQSECVACHEQSSLLAASPNHKAPGFPVNCAECHNSSAWLPSLFVHTNNFPLTGKHLNTRCNSCHESGFSSTNSLCKDCHNSELLSVSDPPHSTLGFSDVCSDCHSTASWKSVTYNHDGPYFPIFSGAHNNQWEHCSDCHTNNVSYSNTVCTNCHEHNQPEMSSAHSQVNGFLYNSSACLACHPAGNVINAFNHSNSQFPLTGAHNSALCSDCHTSGYQGTSSECFSCHSNNYSGALNPNHSAAGISHICSQCHNTTGWVPSDFDHSATGFALIGGHNLQQCSDCHTGSTTGTSNQCFSCHGDDYTASLNPNHTAAGISQVCSQCHNSTAWIPSSFDHSTTGFPLAGGHNLSQCSDCHNGSTTGTNNQCASCHQQNYNTAADPNHIALSLPTDCNQCHTTSPGWAPATFPIHNNFYPLVGAHFNIRDNCGSCHNGTYLSTPNTCYQCHTANFNSATNPNHVVLRFPHDCLECHSQNAWRPSSFNHDQQYFPIFTGEHRNKWDNCERCHTNPSNFAVFSCITCHEHNQTSMNNEHRNVPGYQYLSSACYNCHPNGDAKSLKLHRLQTEE